MIILDTEVLSETIKSRPDPVVMRFLDSLDPTTTYLTAVTAAELLRGITLMPGGNRQRSLENAAFRILTDTFKGRILPFDLAAADRYSKMAAAASQQSKPIRFAEGMIGAIALQKSATVATRSLEALRALDVPIINPWAEHASNKPSEAGLAP